MQDLLAWSHRHSPRTLRIRSAPRLLSHSRSTQQRSEASGGDFGGIFRKQLSTSDEDSEPTNPIRTAPDRSTNQQVASQPASVSGVTPEKGQQSTTQPASANDAEGAPQTLTLPKDVTEPKTTSQERPSAGNNGTATTTKGTRKVPFRSETESGEARPVTPDAALGDQQIAAVFSHADGADAKASDDKPPAIEEIRQCNDLDGTSSPGSTNQVTGDLAMALRIGSASSDGTQMQGQGSAMQGTSTQGTPGLHSQAQIASTVELQQRHEPDGPPPSGAITVAQPGASGETEKAGHTEEGQSTRASDFEAEFNKFRNEPVRGAHVQIAGAENQRVDIRLQERGGALSVTVRSNDSTLATTLQDHAPELSARLSLEHLRTELWTPNSSKSPQERAGSGNGGRNPEYEGSGERQQGQKNRQNQEPDWIREFENRPAAFQKRIDYSWHQ